MTPLGERIYIDMNIDSQVIYEDFETESPPKHKIVNGKKQNMENYHKALFKEDLRKRCMS
jgi:hypothetical protein